MSTINKVNKLSGFIPVKINNKSRVKFANITTEKDIFVKSTEKTLDNINGPYGHPYSGRPIINKTQPSNDILEQLPDDNNELLNLVKTINEDGAGLNKAQTLMESSLLQGADLSNDNITHNLSEQLVDSSDAHYPILEQISDVIKNILNLD